MTEHVILVAVHVTANTRELAEDLLTRHFMPPVGGRVEGHDDFQIEGWWVAEDDRRDGSDNDSAVFVRKGDQSAAANWLESSGFSHEWSNR